MRAPTLKLLKREELNPVKLALGKFEGIIRNSKGIYTFVRILSFLCTGERINVCILCCCCYSRQN